MDLDNIKDTIKPVLEKHGVVKAGIFGSYSSGLKDQNSDIDILVKIDRNISLLEFVRIKLELEDILKKKVDLVEYSTIKPQLRERILSEEKRIYG